MISDEVVQALAISSVAMQMATLEPLTPPYSYMGPGVAAFMALGVLYLLYLYARHPRRVTEVGLVHLDEEPQA